MNMDTRGTAEALRDLRARAERLRSIAREQEDREDTGRLLIMADNLEADAANLEAGTDAPTLNMERLAEAARRLLRDTDGGAANPEYARALVEVYRDTHPDTPPLAEAAQRIGTDLDTIRGRRASVRTRFPTGCTVYHGAGHKGTTPGKVVGYHRPPGEATDDRERVKVAWQDDTEAVYHPSMLTRDIDELPQVRHSDEDF